MLPGIARELQEPFDVAAAQDVADHLAEHARWLNAHPTLRRAIAEVRQLRAELARMRELIDTPRTDEFFAAVQLEAAHQVARWGAAHDAGKTDPDWFWLIGYLAGKALRGDGKRLHHIVTTAAAALNWWRHATGVSTAMRPGIAEPSGAGGPTP